MLPISRRPAWWLLAPCVVLAALYVQQYVSEDSIIANAQAAVAASALLLIFSASLVSVSAALEVGRDRASRGMMETAVRGKMAVVAARLWPSLVAGAIVQFVGILLLLGKAGSSPNSFPVLIAIGLLCALLFHAGIGIFLGTWMRPRFAVPLALAVSYLWLGFAWSFDFVPVRYLAGLALDGCCSPTETIDTAAVVALMVFSILGFISFVVLASGVSDRKLLPRGRANWLRVAAGMLTLVLATSLGIFVARDVAVNPVVPRPISETECSTTVPEVCLFPTQLARGDTRQVYADTFAALENQGMPKVNKVISASTEQEPVLSKAGVANVVAAPGQSRRSALESAASTYAVALSYMQCPEDTSPDIYGWEEVLKVWSVQVAAQQVLSPSERADLPDASTLESISIPGETNFSGQWDKLNRLDDESQAQWAVAAYGQLSKCQLPEPVNVGTK